VFLVLKFQRLLAGSKQLGNQQQQPQEQNCSENNDRDLGTVGVEKGFWTRLVGEQEKHLSWPLGR
jgi:hypothetical protein